MKTKQNPLKALVALILFVIFTPLQAQTINKLWETKGFNTPESVLFSAGQNCLFVSNIGGQNPMEKDTNGFLSVLSTSGEILSLEWATGLHAPKGMAFYENMLVVTDIDRLAFIDTASGKVSSFLPIEGSVFLNDIVASPDGIIVSDSRGKCYYKVKNGIAEKFLCDTSFQFPNGLCLYQDNILSGVGNKVISIQPRDGSYSDYIMETGGVDGLSEVTENSFIISDWTGNVHLIYPDQDKKLLLSTSEEKVNAADFDYDTESGRLYIPTFFANSISAYELIFE